MNCLYNTLVKYVIKNRLELKNYIIIGLVTGGLLIGLYYYLYEILGYSEIVATTFAYSITAITHYYLNKKITFNVKKKYVNTEILRYVIMLVVNYAVTIIGLLFVSNFCLLSGLLNIVLSIFTNAVSSYVLMKFFVFKKEEANI